MTIDLTPDHQRFVERVIHSGAYQDAQDVISAALSKLAEDLEENSGLRRRSRLWELREGLQLGNISVRELIDDGRE